MQNGVAEGRLRSPREVIRRLGCAAASSVVENVDELGD